MLKGENLLTLISYYGNGLTAQADTTRIELLRLLNTEEKTGKRIFLQRIQRNAGICSTPN